MRLVLAAVLTLAVSAAAYAQGSFFTSLSGTVVDTSGARHSRRERQDQEQRHRRRNQHGHRLPTAASRPRRCRAASTRVTVSLMGFKTATLNTVTLNAAVPASVKVTLPVGALEENVTVVGDSALVVQTQSPSVATNLVGDADHQPAADQPQRARLADVASRLQHVGHRAQFDDQRPAEERDQHHARRHEHPGQLPEDVGRLLRAAAARRSTRSRKSP